MPKAFRFDHSTVRRVKRFLAKENQSSTSTKERDRSHLGQMPILLVWKRKRVEFRERESYIFSLIYLSKKTLRCTHYTPHTQTTSVVLPHRRASYPGFTTSSLFYQGVATVSIGSVLSMSKLDNSSGDFESLGTQLPRQIPLHRYRLRHAKARSKHVPSLLERNKEKCSTPKEKERKGQAASLVVFTEFFIWMTEKREPNYVCFGIGKVGQSGSKMTA